MTTILGSLAIQIGNRIRTTEGTERNPNRREDLLRITALVTADGLDNPDRPPEPVAQVRVLPGALSDVMISALPGDSFLQGARLPLVLFVAKEGSKPQTSLTRPEPLDHRSSCPDVGMKRGWPRYTGGLVPLGESLRLGRMAVPAEVAPCRFDASTEPP